MKHPINEVLCWKEATMYLIEKIVEAKIATNPLFGVDRE